MFRRKQPPDPEPAPHYPVAALPDVWRRRAADIAVANLGIRDERRRAIRAARATVYLAAAHELETALKEEP